MPDTNNLYDKLHEVYQKKYGAYDDFTISKGYQVQSSQYQLRLAKIVLQLMKEKESKIKKRIRVIKIKKGLIIRYAGDKTDSEIREIYKDTEKYNKSIRKKRPVGRRKKNVIDDNDVEFINSIF